jgi:hypothetical protein
MNRAERRRNDRAEIKLDKKLFTWEEVQHLCELERRKMSTLADMFYNVCVANVLNSPPYNFGRKRVCKFLDTLLGMIQAFKANVIDTSELYEVARKVGVTAKVNSDGHYIIELDDNTQDKTIRI